MNLVNFGVGIYEHFLGISPDSEKIKTEGNRAISVVNIDESNKENFTIKHWVLWFFAQWWVMLILGFVSLGAKKIIFEWLKKPADYLKADHLENEDNE